ncbi:MAG TPA: hypothetical protein DD640_03830, partial [Clostridiales bacterium]|nr:hypothetical protein [Clostridiales bacterium]
PESDITVSEGKVLSAYLKSGGSMLVIAGFSNTRYTNLNTLLTEFNIEISNDKVREGNKNYRYNDVPYTIRGIAPASTISSTAVDGFTLADNVRGINELKIAKEWIKVEPVLTTSDQGIAEIGGDADQSSAAGTQNIGLMCENSGWVDSTTVTQTAKVIVVGSSSLFADTYVQYTNQLYNAALFYYGIQWLSNTTEEESLYIKAKEVTSYYVNASKTSVNVFTAVVVMVILPGILLLAALLVYRKRKHL